jgi:hypothetical protein
MLTLTHKTNYKPRNIQWNFKFKIKDNPYR